MRIEYKESAVRDIVETRDYIADVLKNDSAAKKLVEAILRAVSLLADNPEMGMPLIGKFDVKTDVRFLVVAKQIVFYQVSGDTVFVIRVIDGRRDYMAILFG